MSQSFRTDRPGPDQAVPQGLHCLLLSLNLLDALLYGKSLLL